MTGPTALPAWTDRVTGCLLGGALGDAVGRPFEGSAPVPAPAVKEVLAGGELTWTDDTVMMLTLAEHLAGLPSWQAFDEGALARAHARAWQAEPWRGYGASPPAIFRTVLAGADWEAAAAGLFGGDGSLGNGAAMRAAPPCGSCSRPSRRSLAWPS
ncbi:ADP-ribosylglycohydrolase family protein, partial [Ornithinicoccus halotolerans]|uniref:ADP-ribosylglycohydrolase family protein n=1 Tax=Ornithinicoccus halotolerans TaxID=1748220 RepID=UPI001885B92D